MEIPEREKWLFENPEALRAVVKGLIQSKEGNGRYIGSFASELDKPAQNR